MSISFLTFNTQEASIEIAMLQFKIWINYKMNLMGRINKNSKSQSRVQTYHHLVGILQTLQQTAKMLINIRRIDEINYLTVNLSRFIGEKVQILEEDD